MLMKQLIKMTEGVKDALHDAVAAAIAKTDTNGLSYAAAVRAIVQTLQSSGPLKATPSEWNDYVRDQFTPDDLVTEAEEEGEPQRIASAGDYYVEMGEDERVRLYHNKKILTTMPLVIWKQLTR